MPVQIRRRSRAAQDAEEIADNIAKDSLDAAIRFLENTESILSRERIPKSRDILCRALGCD